MSFPINFQLAKDFPSNKGEISLLLQEIDTLESKKQELLKTLSFYSSSITTKPVSITDSISTKSPPITQTKPLQKTIKVLTKELPQTDDEVDYENKGDGANKPSHLYMALAKYLFYDQSSNENETLKEEESKRNELINYGKKFVKVTSFDNESLESVSTKDNFSIATFDHTAYKESSFKATKQLCLEEELTKDKKKMDLIWSSKNQKLLCKYADELDNDWSQIAERFSTKKLTPKIVKDHLSNKGSKRTESNASKRTRSRFTLNEDQKIINMIQKIGQNWRDIAKALPGRTEGMVKNRFYSHIKRKYFSLVQNTKSYQSKNSERESKIDFEEPLENYLKEEIEAEKSLDFAMNEEACEIQEEKPKNHEEIQEFLAFFDEEQENDKVEFDERFELNLMKTPETAYNFDEYNNLLKVTPNERENSFSRIEDSCESEGDVPSKVNQKIKIRYLSTKIEDIEHLLQQTKSQINKFYSVE